MISCEYYQALLVVYLPAGRETSLLDRRSGPPGGTTPPSAPFLWSCYFLGDSLGAFTAGAPPLRDAR